MAYGVSPPGMWRRAAEYVDKIARGARTTDLPIEQPTKFEFIVNLKTARTLGLGIPESILARFLMQVGERYPVLGKSGRELLVGVPVDGRVGLVQDGVRLWVTKDG